MFLEGHKSMLGYVFLKGFRKFRHSSAFDMNWVSQGKENNILVHICILSIQIEG